MKIYCIGIGPGGEEQMTLRAVRALEACDCVAGYGLYLDLIDSLIEGKERIQTGMTREVDRCAAALERAKQLFLPAWRQFACLHMGVGDGVRQLEAEQAMSRRIYIN